MTSGVSPDAQLGQRVKIGEGVVVHAGTLIGDDCVLQDGAIVGKPAVLGATSTAAGAQSPAVLGAGVAICAHAVVFAGAELASGTIIGDHAIVRERVSIGERSVVGANVVVENDTSVGSRVKIQTGAYVTAYMQVEDDVFIAPAVVTTNDNSMGRHSADHANVGPVLRRGCRVGAASVLLPGVEIGEEAFVAAGAVVTRDVPPRMLVMGAPAKQIRATEDADRLT